jgi:hypothetical protein
MVVRLVSVLFDVYDTRWLDGRTGMILMSI